MKAMFIGADGSMDLKNGRVYNVEISKDEKYIWVRWIHRFWLVCSCRMECPYGSMEKVLENWRFPQ